MKASASATASSATSSAAACCCISSMRTLPDAGEAYKTVRAELAAYGHGLADKPEIVALNKADALSDEDVKRQAARLKRAAKKTPLVISAVSGKGVPEVLRALFAVINEARAGVVEAEAGPRPGIPESRHGLSAIPAPAGSRCHGLPAPVWTGRINRYITPHVRVAANSSAAAQCAARHFGAAPLAGRVRSGRGGSRRSFWP